MKALTGPIVAFAILAASNAFAWNNLGHKVVAEIAWQQLTPAQRQSIVDTLRRHPRFDADFVAKMEDDVQGSSKEKQDHWIFQHAATWPDLARSLKGEPFDDARRDDRFQFLEAKASDLRQAVTFPVL